MKILLVNVSWYRPFAARLEGLWHKVKGHKVKWKAYPDKDCNGDIICVTCNKIIWCRWHDPKLW